MIFHLARTLRSRRAFVALCLPYVLAAIFVDFLHVGPQFRAGTPAFETADAFDTHSTGPRSDDRCPACLWLQASVPLGSPVVSHSPAQVASSEIETPRTPQSDSPVQHPTVPRGPPPAFS